MESVTQVEGAKAQRPEAIQVLLLLGLVGAIGWGLWESFTSDLDRVYEACKKETTKQLHDPYSAKFGPLVPIEENKVIKVYTIRYAVHGKNGFNSYRKSEAECVGSVTGRTVEIFRSRILEE